MIRVANVNLDNIKRLVRTCNILTEIDKVGGLRIMGTRLFALKKVAGMVDARYRVTDPNKTSEMSATG